MSQFIKSDSDLKEAKDRVAIAAVAFSILIGFVLLRLMQLQLIRGKELREFSENNRISIEKIYPVRGEIYDRNGKLMVGNRPSFDLVLTRGYFGKQEAVVYDFLKDDLGFNDESIATLEKKFKITPKFEGVMALEDVSWQVLAKTRAKNYMLPGVEIVYRPTRVYPHIDLGCHLLGYLREVSKQRLAELQIQEGNGIGLGDYIGVWGIEQVMDADLRGISGSRPVIEDAFGRDLGEATTNLLPSMQKRKAVPGKNLFLTVDMDLQKVAEQSFTGEAGAAIAIDPKTGDILAMVSRPCFDLNKFSRNIPSDYWSELTNNEKKPLYDRATMGIYPPGSTFKVITAAAGLRESATTHPNRYQSCQGSYRIGREVKRCWKPFPGHSHLELPDAIAQSCDVFFYQMGLEVGIDVLAEEARRFGLGETSGIGINREQKGIVPNIKWKDQLFKAPWMDGETASVAIGQGYLAATPLQMGRVASAIANGGKVMKPRLVYKAEDPSTGLVSTLPLEQVSDIGVSPENLKQIVSGMDRAVNSIGGTAYWSGRSSKFRIAGKTGTAQVIRSKRCEKVTGNFNDHAWFIAFAPVENPTIAVAVLVEHGGHGGTAAAPIAKKIIETYLEPPKL
jgi:penicillin-binding protein 2